MAQLQINVYHYGTNTFLGNRFAPYREFSFGEKIVSNADDINLLVNEVRKLFNYNENEVYFKTKVV